jgi:hypothetical protein
MTTETQALFDRIETLRQRQTYLLNCIESLKEVQRLNDEILEDLREIREDLKAVRES